ncbi:MAG: hypothetical protein A2Y24_01395 [Clostridiales bacterium GWE2_32_10]|nr:MAG: hypothetical protein A2Y24_01395 [Clostridiales bacterium GWE2_32_10]HBY19983.1 hypothetical protein [Clostridiales bacterium]
MAVKSRFFKSVNGDRKYTSADFAQYFATLITNGVFAEEQNALQVTTDNISMKTTVKTGRGFINGYYIENDADLILTHDVESIAGTNRIDRVIMKLDIANREIIISIKKGTASTTPVAPTFVQNDTIYELSLAKVTIIGGSTVINSANVVDERVYTRYKTKPAWYPEGQVPSDAWMYVMFKDKLTTQEIGDIEANPSLMDIINNSTVYDMVANKPTKWFKTTSPTTSPTTSNNTTQGYAYGDIWIDNVNQRIYYYLGNDTDGAVWLDLRAVRKVNFFDNGICGGGMTGLTGEYISNGGSDWSFNDLSTGTYFKYQVYGNDYNGGTSGWWQKYSNMMFSLKDFKKLYFKVKGNVVTTTGSQHTIQVGYRQYNSNSGASKQISVPTDNVIRIVSVDIGDLIYVSGSYGESIPDAYIFIYLSCYVNSNGTSYPSTDLTIYEIWAE